MGKDMDGAIGTLVHCWWECKMVQSLWKPLKCCIENVKNEVTIGSSNPTSGYSPNEPKAGPQREYSHTYVRSSAIHNCQEWKQANCPSVDEWIHKVCYSHTIGHCSPPKKEGNSDKCYNMAEP